MSGDRNTAKMSDQTQKEEEEEESESYEGEGESAEDDEFKMDEIGSP